jgi:hypothetical protein
VFHTRLLQAYRRGHTQRSENMDDVLLVVRSQSEVEMMVPIGVIDA